MDNKQETFQAKVMTLQEVRSALRIGRVTALRLVQSGRLPAFRAGRDWRVLAAELDRFMRGGAKLVGGD